MPFFVALALLLLFLLSLDQVVMLAEFLRTFHAAFPSLPSAMTMMARDLEDAIMQDGHGSCGKDHTALMTLVACFVVVAQVSSPPPPPPLPPPHTHTHIHTHTTTHHRHHYH
jgi:hypothetical protein